MIKLVKVGVSAGIGVADIVTEYLDQRQGYAKSFVNVTDWARVGYAVGGYAANALELDKDGDISESAVLAGLPLLEKSIYRAVKEYAKLGKVRGRMGLKLKKKGRKGAGGAVRWG